MTNVPVKRGEAARQQPQVPVTDADREAASELQRGFVKHSWNPYDERKEIAQAIARARADADEAGYSRGLREGAASERAACELALALVERPKKFRADPIRRDTFDDTVAACMDAIRARGEGGKA